jgi:hypothetical protein
MRLDEYLRADVRKKQAISKIDGKNKKFDFAQTLPQHSL